MVRDREKGGVTAVDAQRIADKLDDLARGQATLAQEGARNQGALDGMKLSIETVTKAIGDVTAIKLESRETAIKLDGLHDQMEALNAKFEKIDQRNWVESIVKHVLTGLSSGGAVLIAQRLLHL